MKPKISIIMPCYNAAAHLPQSVGSVLAQTEGDWELVIVDDGSTDASWQELQRLAAADSRIRVFRQLNSGAAVARNRALMNAHGVYTAFLDADDTWHPEFLEAMETALDREPNAGMAYCGWQNIGLGWGRDDPFVPPEYENSGKTASLLESCCWPIHAALVRTRLIHDCGRFDERLSSCMDFDLWLRLGTIHRLIRVPKVLAFYHHHSGEQITKNRARLALNHWRAQQKYLRANPLIRAKLGNALIRVLTDGEILKRGYESYWNRDLGAARQIFRSVMRRGYGKARDWKYMLPSLLPLPLHQALIRLVDRRDQNKNLLFGNDVQLGQVEGIAPTVSIIMPCYNAVAYLPQSMGSVLSQTITNWELIAVDDGSSDGTLAWLKAQTDPRLRVHSQVNQGVSVARNKALRQARGQYTAFLDADDTWAPDFLEKMLAVFDRRPEAVLAYCGWQNVGLEEEKGEPYVPPDYEHVEKWARFLAACPWPIHAALTRSEVVRTAGGFDRRYRNAEDYALWLRIATLGPVVRVPEVLAFYHHHSTMQASRNRERAAIDNLDVQLRFLEAHPEIETGLGKVKVRDLVYRGLLKKAYDCYWQRELKCSRHLFFLVLRAGYGTPRDWKYTLLSMLPASFHNSLAKLAKIKKNIHKQV